MNKNTLKRISADTGLTIEELKKYDVVVLGHDVWLSNWGSGLPDNHTQAVLCHDRVEAARVMDNMSSKGSYMNRIRYHYLSGFLKESISNKSISFNKVEDCPIWNK